MLHLRRLELLHGGIGGITLAGLLLWTWDGRKTWDVRVWIVGAFVGLGALWIAIFPNHFRIHAYQWLLFAPLTGLALGSCLVALGNRLHGVLRGLAWLVAPAVLIAPLVMGAQASFKRDEQPAPLLDYADSVARVTSANSVVLFSSPSMVPVYYSHRHGIRFVANDDVLRSVNQDVWKVFPGSEVFLAIKPEDAEHFSCALSQYAPVTRTPNLILLKVAADACN